MKKIATSTGTTHYTLHGKNIVHLTNGQNALHFFYDASGKPAMVEWNNGEATQKFAYIHNLQGDIVALIDDSGATVVRYTYDAWGKLLSTTGILASTLGKLNPFRYRGYVFDEETGLYYLRSRYYCPSLLRFMNADLICVGGRTNSFTYCDNAPTGFVDKEGTSPVPFSSQDEENFLLFLDAFRRSTKREYEHFDEDPTTEWTMYQCIIETNYTYKNTTPISEDVSNGLTTGGGIMAGAGIIGTILSMTKFGRIVSTVATYLGGIISAIGIFDIANQDPIMDSDEYVRFTIVYSGLSKRPYYKDFSHILIKHETKIIEYLYLPVGEHSGLLYNLYEKEVVE